MSDRQRAYLNGKHTHRLCSDFCFFFFYRAYSAVTKSSVIICQIVRFIHGIAKQMFTAALILLFHYIALLTVGSRSWSKSLDRNHNNHHA